MFIIPCQMVQKLMWKTKRITPSGQTSLHKRKEEKNKEKIIFDRHPTTEN